jgi:hypothetical protein
MRDIDTPSKGALKSTPLRSPRPPEGALQAKETMTFRSLPSRLFHTLASLRLAVPVMVTLATTCATATFYESKHGTAAAQRDVYKTWWFALILATLGTNIFCAMMSRYPWKKHHAGFVMAHIGILTLLAGSLVSLHYGLDSNMSLFEGETTDRLSLQDKALHVALPRQAAHGTFFVDLEKTPPHPGREQRFLIPGSDTILVAEDFEPHVAVTETFEEASEVNPALHFVLNNPFAKEDGWLLARDAARREINFGPASVSFETAKTEAQAKAALTRPSGQNRIVFVEGPGSALRYGFISKSGGGPSGPVELQKPVSTPWMGMTVIVDKVLERARGQRKVTPERPPESDERRMPAVKVHLESPAGRSSSDWLLWTESRTLTFGGEEATLAYRSPEMVVPFRVTLLKFNSDKYPGSNMPATYESWVRIEDPEQGTSEHHISMNHPLHYRGYIFFQASFVEGEPMMSIFSVARAPGLPLVYLGVGLIASGVAWMFYVKPYLARRQAARALAANRQRESRKNEVQPSVPPRPGSAEPASSRA